MISLEYVQLAFKSAIKILRLQVHVGLKHAFLMLVVLTVHGAKMYQQQEQ